MKESKQLSDLITQTLTELSNHNYKASYVHHYRLIYLSLQKYCTEALIESYTEVVGNQYLESVKIQKPYLSHHSMNEYRMAVRRINCTFTKTEWRPFVAKEVPYADSCYNDIVAEYEKYLYQKGKTRCAVRGHVHTVARVLKFAEQQGCYKLTDLMPKYIFDAFKESSNKTSFRNIIRTFLRYAYAYKLITVNLCIIVPGMLHHTSIPTVYSPEEIEILLASIDRQTELGKRNYAMILIAARLGLRACDIAAIKFDCLHLDTSTIEIIQVKTKQPLTLPLLDEVKSAIYDYVDHARPQSANEHIFLNERGYGAILPPSITAAVRRAFEKSGINCNNRKHGSHALRSSLASALLVEGNDFPTIQKVLGHRDIQSTRSYVKVNIEQLRTHALPVPKPAESYERLLADVRSTV